MEVGDREIICLSLYCHRQNDFCIHMGSVKSHFDVFIIVRDKVTKQCPQTTTFEEQGDEQKRNRTEVPLLTSQTGSRLSPSLSAILLRPRPPPAPLQRPLGVKQV